MWHIHQIVGLIAQKKKLIMPKEDNQKAAFKQLKQTGTVFVGCIVLLGFGFVGHCLGTAQGMRQGKWDADRECTEQRDKDRKARRAEATTEGGKKLAALKEKIVFDFETCTVGEVTKAISVADVTVVRALKKIRHYELTVCGSGRYWYDCRGYSCRRVRRRNRHGQRINSYGNRIPER